MQQPPLIVPDVNIIVSGFAGLQSPPAQIMQAWRESKIEIATSLSILADLRRVLYYPRVKKYTQMSDEEAISYIEELEKGARLVEGTMGVNVSPDPTDNKLFVCAYEAQADYIVSGDKEHVLAVGKFE